MPNVVQHFSVS